MHRHGHGPKGGVPGNLAADVRIAIAAALLTFASGLIMLVGYLMAGGFGAFIGLIGAGFGWNWWAQKHDGRLFPRNIESAELLGLGGATAGLSLLLLLMS